ncbi:MAG: hypothetical protein ABIM46_04560 [candidate division WOR-3 bacterium]
MMGNILYALLFQTSPPVFARTYGTNGEDGGAIMVRADEGYALVGYTKSFGAGGMDILLVRTDTSGAILWARTYGGSQNECPNGIVYIPEDSGFVVSGWTYSFGQGLSELLIMRLDKNGDILWAKTFGGPMMDTVCYAVRLANGNLGFLGATQSYGMDENFDPLVLCLDLSGNLLWNRVFGGSLHDYVGSIAPCSDGGCVFAGDGYSAGFTHLFLYKLRSDGSTEWATQINESGVDWPYATVQTPDGGFTVAGYTTAYGQGQQDFLLVRFDSEGNLEWAKAYGGASYDRPYSLIQTSEGGYALFGETWSFGTLSEAMIVKTDASGNLEWARTFGSSAFEWGSRLTQEPSGFYLLSGGTTSFGNGSPDFFLLKIDENGNYGGCVESCSPGVVDIALTTSSPPDGRTCSPAETNPGLSVGAPTLTLRDACGPPLYEIAEEFYGKGNSKVLCVPGKGCAVFILGEPDELKIYSGDGRLIYFGHLPEGKNRIALSPGIYLWATRHQKGRSLVR